MHPAEINTFMPISIFKGTDNTQFASRAAFSAFLIVFAVTCRAESPYATATPVVCTSQYALCTSAPCVPDPTDPSGSAICDCEVIEGDNYGTSLCGDRAPRTHANGVKMVLSEYSFAQAPTHPVISCSGDSPWTDCLDQPCTVDPKNPLRAICKCDIVTGEDFVTYGGACNTNSCIRSFWSAATPQDFLDGSAALMDKMGLRDAPYTDCPGMDIDANGDWIADAD